MKIYIDESGSFIVPAPGQLKTSAVGALVLLEEEEDIIFKKFKALKNSWGDENNEYKGHKLSESQIATVVQMLSETNSTFYACIVDMTLENDKSLMHHQSMQAKMFHEWIDNVKHETFKEDLRNLKVSIEKLALQQYVQMQILTELIDEVLRMATLYYVQRTPETLGQFKWIIDAKNEQRSKYELLWQKTVTTFLQTKSLKTPHQKLIEADYSYMEKFKFNEDASHLSPHNGEVGDDLKKLLKETFFEDSETSLGLQLVDILITATRKTCDGKLQENGWEGIGKLTIQPPKGRSNSLILLNLSPNSSYATPSYSDFLIKAGKQSRQLILSK